MSSKLYKVTAFHEKGYDLGFSPWFLTEKGLSSFISEFEKHSKGKFFYDKTDTGYRIETDVFLNIEEYKPPVFLDKVDFYEVSFCNGGYDNTYLHIE